MQGHLGYLQNYKITVTTTTKFGSKRQNILVLAIDLCVFSDLEISKACASKGILVGSIGRLGGSVLSLELWQYLVLGLVCAFAGLVDAIAGGGGLLTVPMYIGLGLPPQQTLGTNKMASTLGTSMAVFRYLRACPVQRRLAVSLVSAGALGGILGAMLSEYQTRLTILSLLLILVPCMYLLQPIIDARAGLQREAVGGRYQTRYIDSWQQFFGVWMLAFLVGAYDGFFGPGTGTFLIFGLIVLSRFSYRDAAVYGRLINFSSNLGALSVFGLRGRFVFDVALVAMLASMLGNWLGSGLAIRRAESIIRPAFRFVLLLLLLQASYEVWSFK